MTENGQTTETPQELLQQANQARQEAEGLARDADAAQGELQQLEREFNKRLVEAAKNDEFLDPETLLQEIEDQEIELRRIPVRRMAARAREHSLRIRAFRLQGEEAGQRAEQLRQELEPLEEAEADAIAVAEAKRAEVSQADGQRRIAGERLRQNEAYLGQLDPDTNTRSRTRLN